VVKRFCEFLAALFFLLLFSPLMFMILILIRVKLGSPLMFKQMRLGKNGIPFFIYKFRTMTNAKDENGRLLEDEIRLTAFGQFLRKNSLDELPQLVNVLKGEMSLVGPRPLLVDYMPLFNDRQLRRFEVKPGMTGWAQINGRNELSWKGKFELDVWYVENQSFLLDLKISYLTVLRVFRPRGVNALGRATAERFRGNHDENRDEK
jgi:sugar transferase EpsL